MKLSQEVGNGSIPMSVIGLGYVGMPIAVEFACRGVDVIGFDTNSEKINLYRNGIDPTREVGNEAIANTTIHFTDDEAELRKSKFHIVAVPTPVNDDHTPDLRPVKSAAHIVGRNLTEGSIVVFESTVYPGVTEDICIPILESESGLTLGKDFKVGYSPERINPGDKKHRLTTIKKIVSGSDEVALNEIDKIYKIVVDAGTHRAESIKIAEAAKVIENSQRDINIAFMNELSIIFHKLGIDTLSVLKAASTKWNFLPFYPGLVGGHCIGVDPYYLTYKAEKEGYHSQVILSGRQINDGMGKFVGENCVKLLIKEGKSVKNARVAVLGLTFKENCPDTRNTKVKDIINELQEYGIMPIIVDPVADKEEAIRLYNYQINNETDLIDLDAIIIAVAHEEFKKLNLNRLDNMFSSSSKIIMDLKGILDSKLLTDNGYTYWRL